MVVRDDYGRRVPLQRLFDDFAREHARAVDRAAKQFLEVDQPVAIVQIEAAKHLVFEVAQARDQEIARGARTR